VNPDGLAASRALWNRTDLNLDSDEILAQILDRGEVRSWRALYAMARDDARLRARIKSIVLTVPLPLPRFWLAALAGLGEAVDFDCEVPDYWAATTV
jgi:hypothetical protein